jgi:response regulator RpfG family c-di-GMP phosphodiesterase
MNTATALRTDLTSIPTSNQTPIPSILFVDDEANVLTALRRVVRPLGINALIAPSGAAALDLLASHDVDVVVSDMRMPEMSGVAFLKQVAERFPQTIRILLTGYADVASAVAAVNDGQIFRYLNKPWQDNDLLMTLNHAMDVCALSREKQRLEILTRQQNEQLKKLNGNLEEAVQERTQQLVLTTEKLSSTNAILQEGFTATVEVFSQLLRARETRRGIRHREIAALSRDIAESMQLPKEECEAIYTAALLCDVGKMALSDKLVDVPETTLKGESMRAYQEYPAIAEAALTLLKPLETAAHIVHSHRERFNSAGFPDHLCGEAIPIGSRILAVAHDFDASMRGTLYATALTVTQAREVIVKNSGAWYDPKVVTAFTALLDSDAYKNRTLGESKFKIGALRPGMTIAQDLHNKHGLLILRAGQTLTVDILEKLLRMRDTHGPELTVHIKATGGL